MRCDPLGGEGQRKVRQLTSGEMGKGGHGRWRRQSPLPVCQHSTFIPCQVLPCLPRKARGGWGKSAWGLGCLCLPGWASPGCPCGPAVWSVVRRAAAVKPLRPAPSPGLPGQGAHQGANPPGTCVSCGGFVLNSGEHRNAFTDLAVKKTPEHSAAGVE